MRHLRLLFYQLVQLLVSQSRVQSSWRCSVCPNVPKPWWLAVEAEAGESWRGPSQPVLGQSSAYCWCQCYPSMFIFVGMGQCKKQYFNVIDRWQDQTEDELDKIWNWRFRKVLWKLLPGASCSQGSARSVVYQEIAIHIHKDPILLSLRLVTFGSLLVFSRGQKLNLLVSIATGCLLWVLSRGAVYKVPCKN